MENSKQPAYPFEWEHCKDGKVYEFGLTKRELIAAMAMQGMCANIDFTSATGEDIAKKAVICATELLNQLENK